MVKRGSAGSPAPPPVPHTSPYTLTHTPFKSFLAPRETGQVLRTFGFCARRVRQGAYGVCASRRGLVFRKNCTHALGQALVVTMVVPPRLPVPCQPTGPPRATAGVRGAPVCGRGQSSQGGSPRRTTEARSPGSLPRWKRLAGPASLSQPPAAAERPAKWGRVCGWRPALQWQEHG